ncbi:techylectin-5A-like isoform X3 [Parasteatoda tepidariorum]|uniref:techylectin-5A-like isoform X2 n=1 Tax=Parasteatoda tepidariorum TaxID=114398 RepID=UPI001C728750|nr:techylectin-5A-like isoform X3 [Parasteatoda tepidariorum]XP_042897073.1 techylectin-5A-like isoform X2 [Parasteatoda tepidariorum]
MHIASVVSIVIILSYGSEAHMDDLNEETDLQQDSAQQNVNKECVSCQKPADCAELIENGYEENGVYEIYPKNRNLQCSSIEVYCDMKTDGGGWTVIQRRGDFKRPRDYFYKTWAEYKVGFGGLKKDFWLGNDNIHALTSQKKYTVRFDLGAHNETAYAVYDNFWIDDEHYNYTLHINGYSGTAGDAMEYIQNMPFSTKDRKNSPGSTDCSQLRKGGWWYNDCAKANLNGLYIADVVYDSITWLYWKDTTTLSSVEIKIRPHGF